MGEPRRQRRRAIWTSGRAPIDLPGALAVDPAAGRLYWTNWGFIGDGWVSYANLDGSGGQKLPITGATLDTPFGMAIDAPPAGCTG